MKIYCNIRWYLCLLLLALLMSASGTVWSQDNQINLRVVENCDKSVTLAWDGADGDNIYFVYDNLSGRDLGSTGGTEFTLEDLSARQLYNIGVYGGNSGEIGFIARKDSCYPVAPPKSEPIFNCAELPNRFRINGLGNGTHCQTVTSAGVGVPSLVAQGVVDAVDIWGRDSDVEVCFLNHGELKFLDAATSPRQLMDLAAVRINGMTCGHIDRAGTVVLLQAPTTEMDQEESPSGPVVDDSSTPVEAAEVDPVAGCQLMTTDYVSLRVGPSVNYARLDVIPRNRRLNALSRTEAWYRVAYDGQTGWISAEFVDTSGECDTVSDTVTIVLPLETPEEAQMQAPEAASPAEDSPADAPGRMGSALTDCRLRTGDIINLRSGPGLDHDIIIEIPFLTDLTAIDRSWDWFQVEYNGETGWVNIEVVFRNGDCG